MSRRLKIATSLNVNAAFLERQSVANSAANAMGVNISERNFGNFYETETVQAPPRSVHLYAVSSVTGSNRVNGDFSLFDQYSDAFWVGGTAVVWRISNGVLSRIRTSPIVAAVAGFGGTGYVDLADDGGPAVRAGDMLIVERTVMEPSNALAASRLQAGGGLADVRFAPLAARQDSWNGQDPADQAFWVADGSSYFVRYVLTTATTVARRLRFLQTSSTAQTFYYILDPNETYRLEVEIRADASRSVTFQYDSIQSHTVTAINGQPASSQFPVTMQVSTGWQTLSVDFTVAAFYSSGATQNARLTFNDNGQYEVRSIRAFIVGTPYRGLTPTNRARLLSGNFGFIRDHSAVKKNDAGKQYNIDAYIRYYLHHALANTIDLGISKFWLQCELFNPDDYDGLGDYLFAPAGTNQWSALRAQLGRAEPWSDDLKILFEFSNETWNFSEGFYNFPTMVDVEAGNVSITNSAVYGRFSEIVYQKLLARATLYSEQEKLTHIVGGRWAIDYGDVAAVFAPSAKVVARAPYTGAAKFSADRDAMETTTVFQKTLLWPATRTPQILGDNDTFIATAKSAGANAELKGGTYEDQYHSQGVPWTLSEGRWSYSVAGATHWLDRLAQQAEKYSLQGFFIANYGADWASHAPATGLAYPLHLWSEVWNAHCAGVAKNVASFAVTTQSVVNDGTTFNAAPEVGCYILRGPNRVSVVLVNRCLPYSSLDSGDPLYNAGDTGARTVQVLLGVSTADSVTRHYMTGAWNAHNYDLAHAAYDATISIATADASSSFAAGVLSVTLPAAKAEVYVLEGAA